MMQKKWKVTFGVLGIAAFFLLWAALNLWTGRACNFFGQSESDYSSDGAGYEFVTKNSHPQDFWFIVSFKLFAGSALLMILDNAHWRRWWRRAKSGDSGSVEEQH